MLHGKPDEGEAARMNILTLYDDLDIPKYKLRDEPISASVASRLIKNELLDEGNARLNLATFCSTFMEEEAVTLMSETLEKNAIDKSEYPSTIELENRCVNIIADLWNGDENSAVGTSTVGSSEGCMLAGLAMKFRWRNLSQARGLDTSQKRPNLIISAGYQVCWEKFCVYWDVELRTVPISDPAKGLDPALAVRLIDDYTIGIVGILGHTYTGAFDDIVRLNDAVEEYNKNAASKVTIHVDAASGGFYVPFVQPELLWDFRLPNVVSINASGHKYGLVYPGIGWVIWRDRVYLPQELVFEVSYLGGTIPTMAINFSRSASHIIGQYYNFLRLGFSGYRKIHLHTRSIAEYIAGELKKTGIFQVLSEELSIPVICFKLKDDVVPWSLYHLSDYMEMKGWQLPVYALPPSLDDQIVSRIVCRGDLSLNLAEHFIADLKLAMNKMASNDIRFEPCGKHEAKGFLH